MRRDKGRILLGEALPLAKKIVLQLEKSGTVEKIDTVGSLRRCTETVGDIDIVAASSKPQEAITQFTKIVKGKIIEITSVEEIEGGVANERDVEISVVKSNDKWLIHDVSSISHIDTSNWQNSTQSIDQGEISFKYPQDLPASYISVQEWPPKIEITDNEFNCPETSSQDGSVEIITNKIINGKTYCVRATNEGAAGSIYTIYSYSTPLDNKLLTLNFVFKYPNCENYDDSQKTQCFQERQSFDLDNLIDQIVRTIKLN